MAYIGETLDGKVWANDGRLAIAVHNPDGSVLNLRVVLENGYILDFTPSIEEGKIDEVKTALGNLGFSQEDITDIFGG